MKNIIISTVLFVSLLSFATHAKGEDASLNEFCKAVGFSDTAKCIDSKQLKQFKCLRIDGVPDDWRRDLQPAHAMALCVHDSKSGIEGVTSYGCMERIPNTLLLVEKGNSILELANKKAFANRFMPIQTDKEAMTFASIMTDARPRDRFPKDFFIHSRIERGKWLIKDPTSSYAEKKDDGWHVLLYYTPDCGCHFPELIQIEYLIDKDGKVSELNRKVAWHSDAEICVD